ncbi:MAG: hypothetical protein GF398_08040 [Chitinivibrionales bacterium]|nr:hypothetical protein [Chitinivibrionales bacterium]
MKTRSVYMCMAAVVPLVIICTCAAYGTYLSVARNSVSLPFLAHYNPALLCYEKGLPAGSIARVNLDDTTLHIISGLVHSPQSDAAFAFGSQHDVAGNLHILSGSFCDKLGDFSWGSSFDLLLVDNEVGFTLDAAAAYAFAPWISSSLVLSNMIETDTSRGELLRKATFTTAAVVLKEYDLFFNFDATAFFYKLLAGEVGAEIDVHATKKTWHNPALHTGIGAQVKYRKSKDISYLTSADIGVSFLIREAAAGIISTVELDPKSRDIALSLGVYVNPLIGRDTRAPFANVHFSNRAFSPNGDGISEYLLIALECKDDARGKGLKQWSMVITADPADPNAAIRIYSQASAPPSTILWDGRNAQGDLVEPGAYYVRLSACDKAGNCAQSSWERVIMTER